jgi:hypothetical protein
MPLIVIPSLIRCYTKLSLVVVFCLLLLVAVFCGDIYKRYVVFGSANDTPTPHAAYLTSHLL